MRGDSATHGRARFARFGFCFEWSAIESRLSLGGCLGEEVQEELVGLFPLAACSFKQAAQHAMVFQAVNRASALNHFAHDDDGSQASLSLVIGGRNIGATEAGEEVFLLGTEQAFAESFSLGIVLTIGKKPVCRLRLDRSTA